MNGCRWQEKSFSVSVMQDNLYVCVDCKKEIETVFKYNGDIFCKECFSKKKTLFTNRISGFNTHKDLAYNFTTDMFDGKPVEVHGKRHFKNLLKSHGMVDASIKECFQEARFRKKINEEDYVRDRRKTAEDIYCRMKGRGQIKR